MFLHIFLLFAAARKRSNAFPHATQYRHGTTFLALQENQTGQYPFRGYCRWQPEIDPRLDMDNHFTFPGKLFILIFTFH